MKNLLKLLSFTISLLYSHEQQAQSHYNSMYSHFGIGDLELRSFSLNSGMAGTGIGVRSFYALNAVNPAAYNAVNIVSTQITNFGYSSSFQTVSNQEDQINNSYSNLDYFSLWFKPNSKMAVLTGISPYSKVGYKLQSENFDDYSTYSEGSGGLNRFFVGSGFTLVKGLSLGINANVLWGSINESKIVEFESYGKVDIRTIYNMGSFQLDYGLQYEKIVRNRSTLTLGIVFNNKTELNTRKEVAVYYGRDSVLDERKIYQPNYVIPRTMGLGLSFFNGRNWTVASDIYIQDWGTAYINETVELQKRSRYSVGVDYLPEIGSMNYLKRIGYRMGLFYDQSYIKINNKDVNTIGASAGLSLPLRNFFSRIDLTFNYESRGEPASNLVREDVFSVGVSLDLHDFWFQKRKME